MFPWPTQTCGVTYRHVVCGTRTEACGARAGGSQVGFVAHTVEGGRGKGGGGGGGNF